MNDYEKKRRESLSKILKPVKDINLLFEMKNRLEKLYKDDNSIITELTYLIGNDMLDKKINNLKSKIKVEKHNNVITFNNLSIVYLNEGTIVEDRINSVSIGCFNDENRNYSVDTAYFKFFNSSNYTKATKLARITLLNPTYVYHRNPKNVSNWDLNHGELELLNTLMNLNIRGESVWFWLCYEFNRETGNNFEFGNKIPDFSKINGGKKNEPRLIFKIRSS